MSLLPTIRYCSFAALMLLACSCSLRTYTSQVTAFYNPYKAGNATKAAEVVAKKAESRGKSVDGLLWRLEEGTVMLADGRFDESLAAFTKAEAIVEDYDGRATVNFRAASQELASAVTNPTAVAYKGRAYDRIMLNTYKCLAYMRKGDMEAAKVEMRRAYSRQQEAVKQYSKSIEKEQRAGREKGVSYDDTRQRS
ncbi:hypothetical protein BVY04_00940, partial [bacterium M21]